MENIIAQKLTEMQGKILQMIGEKGLGNIGALAEEMLDVLKSGTCEMLSGILEATDQSIVDARAMRKADGLKIKEKNVSRNLLISIGELRFRRTYYETEEGERLYLLDLMIGIEPYERVSKAVCAKLVNLAAEMSYGKSAAIGEVPVSRQTVCNKVHGLKEVVADVERVKETPKELHIFTDEDHVHMNDGKNEIVPIATITEGVDTGNPKRHKLIKPLHIAGYGMDGETFNDQVEACVNERYDINAVERIYIHGDGASRIVSLGESFPNACHVLDGFHFEKYMKKLSHYTGAPQRMGAIRSTLKSGNWESCRRLLDTICQLQADNEKKKCKDVIQYIWNNREAIQRRLNGDLCGSCTESIVSHVLSERLSRTPLGWSKCGLGKMTMLRVYVKNGHKITEEDTRVSIKKRDAQQEYVSLRGGWKKYNNYMNRQIDSILSTDWLRAFEHSSYTYGKVDATYLIQKSLGSLQRIA